MIYDEKTNRDLLREAEQIAVKAGYKTGRLGAGRLSGRNLEQAALVLYCMGGRYREGTERDLSEYVQAGGTLVVLGGNPFSQPVGDAAFADMHKGIRAFGFSDTFQEAPCPEECSLRILRQNWDPYGKGEEPEEIIRPDRVYAGLYRLSHKTGERDMERHGDLLPIAGFYDREGHMTAAPVVRVSGKKGGRIYFFTWEEGVPDSLKDTSEETFTGNVLSGNIARELLEEICKVTLSGFMSFEAEMTYARYFPQEEICLELHSRELSGSGRAEYDIEVREKGKDLPVYSQRIMAGSRKQSLILPITEEGEYEVQVRGLLNGVCQMIKRTGFYVVCEEKILEAMDRYPRMIVDPLVCADFCVQDGKQVCIHGTTYFVTDTYQKCFLHFNLAQCREDLALLQRDGFNVLRSGNWMLNLEFYGKDGSISEKARRALQAYFYCAMQHGFTVQFTLGIITLNDWDHSLCAVHNPVNTKKVLRLVDFFGELFGKYTNVMLDIINEPSYSYAGQWKTCRPSGDPYERKAWIRWLKDRYGTIEKVRMAWGENALTIPDFASIDVPGERCYEGSLYRTEEEREYAMAAEFWLFAQQSYLRWLSKVCSCLKEKAPDMVVMMGRDESLRVPEEQDMILSGNLDMVCWHQWSRDAVIYVEYLLNRVKGRITCAQEMGIYRVERMRGGKILSDERVAHKLERKLFFGFSNWIIWQSFHNPDKEELCENMLGTYRSDRSETPAMPLIRQLINAENRAVSYMSGRQEDAFPILTLYSTSSHYSLYGAQAVEALRQHIFLLNNCLRMQSDLIPEHLFDPKNRDAIGNPALIVVPGVMRMTGHCFDGLLEYARAGGCVLISGNVDEDEHFARVSRRQGGREDFLRVKNFEKIRIGEASFTLDFRKSCEYGDAENFLTASVSEDTCEDGVFRVKIYPVGEGKVIYCPLPLELAENREAALALYRMALREAGITAEVYETEADKEAVCIHAIVYKDCTSYTVVNEGPADRILIRDMRSNTAFCAAVPGGRGCKFWVGTDGRLLEAYGDVSVVDRVGGEKVQ